MTRNLSHPATEEAGHCVASAPTGLSGASAPLNAMPAHTMSEKADKPLQRRTGLCKGGLACAPLHCTLQGRMQARPIMPPGSAKI
jgi:hypothetical protein